MDQLRELFAGYIPGTIRSLKNSRRLVYPRLKGGVMTKPKFIPSKAYKKWEAQALASLIHQLQARKATGYRYPIDRKSTRLNSSHVKISYAVFCLKKTKK